ncbi:hypothetical protein TcasGA2_TC000860 [Tribolium castaneum]|uniref:Uncharacterized protein n=1 Tax=Tribolium castaneum TaxID=7070 RepID=D6W8T5_TRICA|nr:hypothetical protein TcasGA2_TC000860 [Tribolium castaneum]
MKDSQERDPDTKISFAVSSRTGPVSSNKLPARAAKLRSIAGAPGRGRTQEWPSRTPTQTFLQLKRSAPDLTLLLGVFSMAEPVSGRSLGHAALSARTRTIFRRHPSDREIQMLAICTRLKFVLPFKKILRNT